MKKNVVFSLLGAFVCSSALFVNAGNSASLNDNLLRPDTTATEQSDSSAQCQKGTALAFALFSNDSTSTDSCKAEKAEAALMACSDTVANDTAKEEAAAASLLAYTDSVATDTTKAEPASCEAKAETLLALL
ncbi:MAG: hypothetical protein ACOYJE_08085 [Bacteroidaceae bacterium]|jgi:hypothetical protein